MHARRVPQLVADRHGGAIRWRRAAVVTLAAALPVTVIAATAGPASAAGGYTVTATIAVGNFPSGVAVDPTTGNVYVTNERDDTVSAIDEATDTVTATIGVGCMPGEVAVDPKGTAVIAGTPAASAKGKAYAITLTARDGAGHAVSQRFTLTVS
jgi:YVTN family beta-propeller protein